jgi:hypothetical protein
MANSIGDQLAPLFFFCFLAASDGRLTDWHPIEGMWEWKWQTNCYWSFDCLITRQFKFMKVEGGTG